MNICIFGFHWFVNKCNSLTSWMCWFRLAYTTEVLVCNAMLIVSASYIVVWRLHVLVKRGLVPNTDNYTRKIQLLDGYQLVNRWLHGGYQIRATRYHVVNHWLTGGCHHMQPHITCPTQLHITYTRQSAPDCASNCASNCTRLFSIQPCCVCQETAVYLKW